MSTHTPITSAAIAVPTFQGTATLLIVTHRSLSTPLITPPLKRQGKTMVVKAKVGCWRIVPSRARKSLAAVTSVRARGMLKLEYGRSQLCSLCCDPLATLWAQDGVNGVCCNHTTECAKSAVYVVWTQQTLSFLCTAVSTHETTTRRQSQSPRNVCADHTKQRPELLRREGKSTEVCFVRSRYFRPPLW